MQNFLCPTKPVRSPRRVCVCVCVKVGGMGRQRESAGNFAPDVITARSSSVS